MWPTNIASFWWRSLLRDKCADAEAENNQLQRQVLAARGDVAVRLLPPSVAPFASCQDSPHLSCTRPWPGQAVLTTVILA